MTTLVGFKRNKEVVVAWDTQTTAGNMKYHNKNKGIRFPQIGPDVTREWFMATSGDATVGSLAKSITQKFLSKSTNSPLGLTEVFIEEFRDKFTPFHYEGSIKSIALDAILGCKDGLFAISCDFGVSERETVFFGSGGQIALGVYEALKNTKISNMQLLKKLYGIVGKLDVYTSEEFVTNIAG